MPFYTKKIIKVPLKDKSSCRKEKNIQLIIRKLVIPRIQELKCYSKNENGYRLLEAKILLQSLIQRYPDLYKIYFYHEEKASLYYFSPLLYKFNP